MGDRIDRGYKIYVSAYILYLAPVCPITHLHPGQWALVCSHKESGGINRIRLITPLSISEGAYVMINVGGGAGVYIVGDSNGDLLIYYKTVWYA